MTDRGGLRVDRKAGGVAFSIQVTPRAKKQGLGGVHGDALRVAIAAPPVEGKANAACRRALAEALGVRRADVELDAGSKGRRKRVVVVGDPTILEEKLKSLAADRQFR